MTPSATADLLPARIAGVVPRHLTDPILVLYGAGVTDSFACADLLLRSLDQVLWLALRARGFEQVVFCSAARQVYFIDEQSRQMAIGLSRRPGIRVNGEPSRSTPQTAMSRFPAFGPQGDVMHLNAGYPVPADSTAAPARLRGNARRSPGPGPMEDASAVKMLAAFMKDATVKTAVVIKRASFLNYFEANRELAEAFGELIWNSAAHSNLCVLTFDNRNRAEIMNNIGSSDRDNSSLRSHLAAQIANPATPALREIGGPDPAEVTALLHHVRLKYGLRIADWTRFEAAAARMSEQKGKLAKDWLKSLRELADAPKTTAFSEAALEAAGLVPQVPERAALDRRLNELVGMAPVKERIRALRARAQMESGRRRAGAPNSPAALHMVFKGNPGTGKTTIAEMLGEIFREAGLLRTGHVHAPTPDQLVGKYVGQTAPLVLEAVKEATGGILFIDEAYTLTAPDRGGFGKEAVDTLLVQMEKLRADLVVIVAGYTAEMDSFLQANPGLPSRIATTIEFPDYSPPELEEIFRRMCAQQQLTLSAEVAEPVKRIIEGLYRDRDRQFGNAREMRNLFEAVVDVWATRIGAADFTAPIEPEDFQGLPDWYRRYL